MLPMIAEWPARRARLVCAWAAAAVVAFMIAVVMLNPIVYETDHFADTHFILGAAWRTYQGLTPALDFGHFYGGFTSWVTARAFGVVGPKIQAFDFALLMLFCGFGVSLLLMAWRRVSLLCVALAMLTLATLMFTRYPLEVSESVTRIYATHSFLYNRVGLAIVLIVGLFALLPGQGRMAEVLGGAVAGALLVVVLLTKPTFVILIPAAFLAMAVQARWTGAVAMLLSCGVVLILADPWGARWLASFAYAMAHVGEDTPTDMLLIRAIKVPLHHPIALTFVLAALAVVLMPPPRPWRQVLAGAVMAGAATGMATTMGGGGGQLALPIFILLSLVTVEIARRQRNPLASFPQIGTAVLVFAFALPHAANLLGSAQQGWAHRSLVLIEDGPLADYVSVVRVRPRQLSQQYETLAEGIAHLEGIEGISAMGIVADNNITFEFALQSRPVPGFPLWQRATAPEFAPDSPLPMDVDVILVGHGSHTDRVAGAFLRREMGEDFARCATTAFWQIYARRGAALDACRQRRQPRGDDQNHL